MKNNNIFRIIGKILLWLGGLLIAAIIALVAWVIVDLNSSLETVTDITQYSKILNNPWKDSPLVQHFPKTIPAEAKNVKIHYVPGFLQGGSMLQLQMTLPPAKIAEIQAQLRKVAQRKYIPGAKDNSPTQETPADGRMSITFDYKCYLGKSGVQNFPENYEILVLSDTRGAPTYNWKHSQMHGVTLGNGRQRSLHELFALPEEVNLYPG
jgi:hypothetical protein